jgi:hypothetical protein
MGDPHSLPRALRPICLKKPSPAALPPLISLLDYKRADGDHERERLVRRGIAAILGTHLEQLDQATTPWTRWQGSTHWAQRELEPLRQRILEITPPEERQKARALLIQNMDT